MNIKLLLLFLFIGFSCEKQEEIINPYECMTCIRTIKEDGIVMEEIELFVCGEELAKQKSINYTYVNEYYGTVISVSTFCFFEPCKDDKNR